MKRHLSLSISLILTVLAWPCLLFAQEDPFGGVKKSDAKGKKKDEEVPLVLQREREHPLILSLRETPPKSLLEVTRALKITLEIDRPVEFKQYAAQWLAMKPSADDMVALHTRYGPSFFWELTHREAFAPAGEEIGNRVLEAAATDARDQVKLTAAVQQLFDDNTQAIGIQRLAKGSTSGVIALLHHAAVDNDPQHHELIQKALITLRQDAIGPCIAALYAEEVAVRVDAALVLGRLNPTEAVLHLVGPAVRNDSSADSVAAMNALKMMTKHPPQRAEVVSFLERRINLYLAGELPAEIDAENRVALWQWNTEKKMPELRYFTRPIAPLIVASALAKHLQTLQGEQPIHQALSWRVRLEAEKHIQGLNAPLNPAIFKEALALPVTTIEQILLDALKSGQFAAATACCEILASVKQPDLVRGSGAKSSSLVQALDCPDQRTQLAAVRAILNCANEQPYAGSSRVVETMEYLLSGVGHRKVLIAHPRELEATRIAALYSSLGFHVQSAVHGSDLLRLAQQSADVEMILLSDALDRPSVGETLQMLRQDIRSARIPVGMMVVDPDYDRGADLAQRGDSRAEVVYPPHNESTVRFNNQLLSQHVSPYAVPSDVRAEHATILVQELTRLMSARQRPQYYDYSRLEPALETASVHSYLAADCFQALAKMGTPRSQAYLLQQAALPSRDLDQRKIAVAQFTASVEQFGVQVTQSQRLQIRDLYREETSNPQNYEVLQQLLKVLQLSPEDTATLKSFP